MVSTELVTLSSWLTKVPSNPAVKIAVEAFAEGAIDLSDILRRGELAEHAGYTEETNVQGEQVHGVDAWSNSHYNDLYRRSGVVHAVVSEEDTEPTFFNQGGEVDVYEDPADGSKNLKFGLPVGSIAAFYEHEGPFNDPSVLLRPGREMAAAAYVNFSTSVCLVLRFRDQGVQVFTLDPDRAEFVLTRENVRFPQELVYESTNWCNEANWDSALVAARNACRSQGISGRYIGALVSDTHRNLLGGGIFLYLADKKNPNGKLRLMYEEAPIAFIGAGDGYLASNGVADTLDITPVSFHQREPFIIAPEAVVRRLIANCK